SATCAERYQGRFAIQPISALDDATSLFRFHDHQVRVRCFWPSKQTLKQDLLVAIPSARRFAVEHPVKHAVPTFGTEAAISVESGNAIHARPIAQFAADIDSGCVVVGQIPSVKPFLGPHSSRRSQTPNAPKA